MVLAPALAVALPLAAEDLRSIYYEDDPASYPSFVLAIRAMVLVNLLFLHFCGRGRKVCKLIIINNRPLIEFDFKTIIP